MPTLIEKSTQVVAAGTKPKLIEEFVGYVNSKTARVSVARMRSPAGWSEPGQTPEFDEYSIVLSGMRASRTRRVSLTSAQARL